MPRTATLRLHSTVILYRLDRDVVTPENARKAPREQPAHFVELVGQLAALQDFGQDEVTDGRFLGVE